MKSVLIMAALSTIGFSPLAQAQNAGECSEFELLKLTNEIDRMNHPSQLEMKCIAQQEAMKAHAAMTFEKQDSCLVHMRNVEQTISGNPPADMKPVAACEQ